MLTVGSVCSGIAAPETAWRGLPFNPLWFAEIDPFPSAVLAHRYPQVPNHGDFTALLRPENRPADVDVLVGGTPCQAFSVAGLRGGLTDPRGNLALAFVALVDVLRPRWVLWENVPGVLSSGGGRDFGAFLGALGHIGYGFAYRVLDAQYFGLAQRRKRVFVVASPGDWRGPAAVLLEPESVRWDSPPRRRSRAGVAGSLGTGASDGGGWRVGADEAAAGHVVAAGVPDGACRDVAHALKAKHNSDHREDGETYVATACLAHPQRQDFDVETFVAHTLRGNGHDASEDGTGRGVPLVPVAMAVQESEYGTMLNEAAGSLRADRESGGTYALAPVAMAEKGDNQNGGTMERRGVRRLTPREQERLQGFEDGWTLVPYRGGDAADGPRSKAIGNSMAVPVLRWIGERMIAVDAARSPSTR